MFLVFIIINNQYLDFYPFKWVIFYYVFHYFLTYNSAKIDLILKI